MKVFPGVNCGDEKCLEARFSVLRAIAEKTSFGKDPLVHLDISDGIFTPLCTVQDPEIILRFQDRFLPRGRIAVHLMVQNPFQAALQWLFAGAERVFVHFDACTTQEIEKLPQGKDGKMGFVVTPETQLEEFVSYAKRKDVRAVLVLAVRPGASGQHFDERALRIIRILRSKLGGVTIEVDGGINAETIAQVRRAGADAVSSTSFIFGNADPVRAFQELREQASL